tara:strand:+ start:138 stop:962 length:825 start_codon:yes stop_codon:yes gene_type:complete
MKIFLTILIFSTTFISCNYSYNPYSYKSESPYYHLEKAQKTKQEKVKTITLHYYTDTIFPNEDIMSFKNLESIYISGPIRNLSFGLPKLHIDTAKLKKFTKLKHLSFSYYDFKIFPRELLVLENLKALSLEITNIEQLPTDLNRLKKLEFLSLRLNNLKSLPNSIGLMDSLKILDLGNNLFENLPEILTHPNHLQYVSFVNPEGSGIFRKYEIPSNKINYLNEKKNLEKIVVQSNMIRTSIEVNSCDIKKYLKNLLGHKLNLDCKYCGDCYFKL